MTLFCRNRREQGDEYFVLEIDRILTVNGLA